MKLSSMRTWVLLGLMCTAFVAAELEDDLLEDDEFEPAAIDDDIMVEDDEVTLEEKKPIERPNYKTPELKGGAHFTETFDDPEVIGKTWVKSTAKKDDTDENIAKYDGVWSIEEPTDNPLVGDLGLVLKSKARHHAIAANLKKPFEFKDKPFIVQYEVKFQNGQECGGAYIKLLTEESKPSLEKFFDKTPYTIMFGPDKCGNDNKLHFIFRHKHPKSGDFEEKHAKRPKSGIDAFFSDKKTHLFTLVVSPDNTFEILVDQNVVSSGSLLQDVDPPVNPPKEIVDPNDKKPKDWDEREKIPDPDAEKPDDWDESQPEKIEDPDAVKPEGWLDDEPELIPDPDAEKPNDWDEDMDGEWEAPMISNPACEEAPGCGEWKRPEIKNPKYKGKWKPSMIDNPDYQGKWKPKMIPNPDYFEDNQPFKMTKIGAVGLELWSMSSDIYFDNFIITDDRDVADKWAADTWELKHEQELLSSPSGKSVVEAVMDATRDRPWLWAVIILVVILPLVLIIAYCCMPSSTPPKVMGILQWLLDSAEERKWLYGVYCGAILLPLALLSVWCCPNTGWGVKKDDVARAKKTDEASPDDDVIDENGGGDDKVKPSASKKKASKSALEAEEENEADAEEDEEAEEEEEEEEEEEKEEETESQPKKSSPRRRKNKPQKE